MTTRAEQRERTQQRILTAARRLFAEHGYERTTVRAVAAEARTDPGLVMRYFGSKEQLFAQVADLGADDVLAGSPEQVLENVLAGLTEKLTTEPTAMLAMLRSMLTHPEAADHVREELTSRERQLAAAIPADDAAARAGVVGAITLGTVIARHLLRLEGVSEARPEQVAELLRPGLAALLLDRA